MSNILLLVQGIVMASKMLRCGPVAKNKANKRAVDTMMSMACATLTHVALLTLFVSLQKKVPVAKAPRRTYTLRERNHSNRGGSESNNSDEVTTRS